MRASSLFSISDNQAMPSTASPLGKDWIDSNTWQTCQLLQTTLDLEQMLTLFYHQLQTLFELHGFSYIHQSENICFVKGEQHTHQCSYRLQAANNYLGEATFLRNVAFVESELVAIETLLTTLMMPLRNCLMYRSALANALKDPLTGAGNRLAMSNAIHREIAVARRENTTFAILMLDLDYFKQINDTHGHLAGDYCLKHLVDQVESQSRDIDQLFRYGGEEFVLLLRNTDLKGATIKADRIRRCLAESPCQYKDAAIELTLSIGITLFQASDCLEHLLERADAALYECKTTGRNKISVKLASHV